MAGEMSDLTFAEVTDTGTDLWSPDESGVYALDNKIGRGYADDCIRYMRDREAPSLLGHVMRRMVARGKFGGVEVGFAHRIAVHAAR